MPVSNFAPSDLFCPSNNGLLRCLGGNADLGSRFSFKALRNSSLYLRRIPRTVLSFSSGCILLNLFKVLALPYSADFFPMLDLSFVEYF